MPSNAAQPSGPKPLPPGDRHELMALIAAAIEGLERGEADAVTMICAARPELAPHVRRKLGLLTGRGLLPPPGDTPVAASRGLADRGGRAGA